MYVRTYVCMYSLFSACTYVRKLVHVGICFVIGSMLAWRQLHVSANLRTYIHTCVATCARMCICMFVHMHICTYVLTQKWKWRSKVKWCLWLHSLVSISKGNVLVFSAICTVILAYYEGVNTYIRTYVCRTAAGSADVPKSWSFITAMSLYPH